MASWLPGTEGDGRGRRAVRQASRSPAGCPVTWPTSEAQLPINVGDAAYDPQYPYGWGLRTDPRGRASRRCVTRSPPSAAGTRGRPPRADRPAQAGSGGTRGSLRDPNAAFAKLAAASHALSGPSANVEANADLLVSVARDLAQSAIVAHGAPAMSRTAALTANAEHALLVGDPEQAVDGLADAWHEAQH